MKFGCFSLDFRRFSLDTAFRMAARYGFDGIEIWGGRPHGYPYDMDGNEVRHVLDLKKTYGLEVPMYTPNALGMPYSLCSLDGREQRDALHYFRTAIDACEAMEVPRMLLVADHPGYEVPRKAAWNRFIENMKELGGYAKEHSVKLVIEALTPMESPVITTADDCREAIDAIGLSNIEAMMDVVPPVIAYEPLSAYFEKLEERMNYIHLCSNDRKTDAHLRLDTGELPVRDMVRVFKEHGFEGYVTVELYSECYSDPEVLLANSSRILKEIREELNL
ncbi:MAG: TIM barrel protein [Eubacteriales bacterium]|nr:TIM barrel protein [Eubacteriales bacterium]